MKKNNTTEKTVLKAEEIAKALKEGTQASLRNIVNEAISNAIRESEEDTEEEDDSYSVEDVDTEETPEVTDGAEAPEEIDAEGNEEAPEEGDEDASDDEDDEWSDMEQYKVGDNDYDFTSVEGDDILKVYNKLGDDDQIFVQKKEDGTYEVKDDETGAEFVIELNPDAVDDEADNEEPVDVDTELDIDLGGEEEAEPIEDGNDEIEIDLGDNEEDDELNENLGYTDSYQKDVFDKKFNMNEPADSKTTNDWDEGAPKGAEKPWAGKGDSKPFEKKVNECGAVPTEDEANLEEGGIGHKGKVVARSNAKTQMKDYSADVTRHDSEGGEYHEMKALKESMQKIIAKAKEIQAENKQYKEYIGKIKNSLYEAAVLNVNMGKLVEILVNETTTKDEKKRICERFNNVKTIAEGKNLYATIKSELNEAKASAPSIDKQFVAESKQLNETTIYQNTNNPSLDLMTRMDNLYK